MEKENPNPTLKNRHITIQEYLSLGYLYLVLLGLISDVIYYKFIGVDILLYSTVLDILISPVNIIAKDPIVLLLFALTITAGFLFLTKVLPKLQKKKEGEDKPAKKKEATPLMLVVFFIFSMYMGFGIGKGDKISDRLETGNWKPDHLLHLTDQQTIEVKVLGQNSTYIFYVVEGQKEVSISPIMQNIREIRRLPEED